MKRIFSAGGIILRLRSGSSVDNPKYEVLVTQHSGHHGWDFPKGHIEEGESGKDAALREVLEETGVKAEVIEKVGDTKYFYYEKDESPSAKATEDRKVFKTVIFYLMKYMGQGKATTAFEVSAMEWLPIDEVENRLTFADTKKLWKSVKVKIKNFH